MNSLSTQRPRLSFAVSALATAALLACSGLAQASSHREAPFIAGTPKLDGTDFYLFRSYETGRTGFVTMIANYLPLQDSYGGPNYFSLDPDALYEIHLDNNGDAREDITFQFRFKNTLAGNGAGVNLMVGGKSVNIPLIQAGVVSDVNSAALQYRQTYSVNVMRGELGTSERPLGSNCTPYGPCEAWCADFATWVWRHAGVSNIGRIAYVPNLVLWAKQHGSWKPGSGNDPQPGDMVIFSGLHVGIVERVAGPRWIVTIEGNHGNRVARVVRARSTVRGSVRLVPVAAAERWWSPDLAAHPSDP